MVESSPLTSPSSQQRQLQSLPDYGSLLPVTATLSGDPKVAERFHRSQVSHAFLLKKDETQHLAASSPGSTLHVLAAINASLSANVVRLPCAISSPITTDLVGLLAVLDTQSVSNCFKLVCGCG